MSVAAENSTFRTMKNRTGHMLGPALESLGRSLENELQCKLNQAFRRSRAALDR